MRREKRLQLSPIWYIYKTTCIINNKIYIGKHKCYDKVEKAYLGSGKLLWLAINKYGKDNFIQEVIEFCDDEQTCCEREKFWIKELKSQDRKIGYNISPGGEGGVSGWNRETNKWMSINIWENYSEEERLQRINKMQTALKQPEILEKISKKAKEWHNNMTEEEKRDWIRKISKPKCSNKNYIGDKNSMFGKSVYDIWLKKFGKEKADTMWVEKSKKCALSGESKQKMKKSLKERNEKRKLSPYWKEFNKEQHKIQELNFKLKKEIITQEQYNFMIVKQRQIVSILKDKVNLILGENK